MPEPTSVGLPAWVYKRDGRLVPFEADRICQALFAATESLGKPDAFLARELTDGTLHFLARENPSGSIPSTVQIAELVVTVVRELGQPALAQVFAEGKRKGLKACQTIPVPKAPDRPEETRPQAVVPFQFSLADPPGLVVQDCLREYSLWAIFSRDLRAAHRDGLLILSGLETPQQLVGCVFDLTGRGLDTGDRETSAWPASRRSGALVQALQHMRQRVGSFLAIDGPEYALSPFASAGDLAKNSGELQAGLEATGLAVVVNLNCARPPRWAEEPLEGPLFAEPRRSPPAHLEEYRTVLLEQLNRPAFAGRVRIDWHLSERDFSAAPHDRLCRLVRWALDFPGFSFTFDRPNRPISLGEGVDRKFPAVLLEVGLHLPRLLELPGVRGNPESFLVKLTSLARMAVSAGVQKRNFLKRQSPGPAGLSRGFLLDRARLIVVPVGLETAARGLARQGIGPDPKLGGQILSSLLANLRQAAQAANLDVSVDGPCWSRHSSAGGFAFPERQKPPGLFPVLGQIAGLTPWDPDTPARTQLQAAGPLHAAVAAGSAAVLIPQDPAPAPEELAELLVHAWKRTEVVRLRFVHLPHQQQQLAW